MSLLKINKKYFADSDWTIDKVQDEINSGLEILNKIDKPIISFFGSHKVDSSNSHYIHAKDMACKLGQNGYAILSGGGPGIMHAANTGAKLAKTESIGFKAELLTDEKITDDIFTHEMDFHFLFARRFLMAIKSEALIFYPGGYGTLNELFEYAVLMQTKLADIVPIICVEQDYWEGLFKWLNEKTLENNFLKNNIEDINLISIEDDFESILKKIIRK